MLKLMGRKFHEDDYVLFVPFVFRTTRMIESNITAL